MATVFVEPQPRDVPEGDSITHYSLEFAQGARVTEEDFRNQAAAVSEAKRLGHDPQVARVRNTDKENPDHWQPT